MTASSHVLSLAAARSPTAAEPTSGQKPTNPIRGRDALPYNITVSYTPPVRYICAFPAIYISYLCIVPAYKYLIINFVESFCSKRGTGET